MRNHVLKTVIKDENVNLFKKCESFKNVDDGQKITKTSNYKK